MKQNEKLSERRTEELEAVVDSISESIRNRQPYIVVTRNITSAGGSSIDIMVQLTQLLCAIKESGFSEEKIKKCIELGFSK